MEETYTKQEILNGYCEAEGYQADLIVFNEDGSPASTEEGVAITEPNPETKFQFLERTERENSIKKGKKYLEGKAVEAIRKVEGKRGEGATME